MTTTSPVEIHPRFETLVQMLDQLTPTEGDHVVFSYLDEGETPGPELRLGELRDKARRIAADLRVRDLEGRCVLLLYAPGLDFVAAFFGCLYAGAIAVPAYPPDPVRLERSMARLEAIANDAGTQTILTTKALREAGSQIVAQAGLAAMTWIETDPLSNTADGCSDWGDRDPDSLAFLQYTSGSTATPKGVMITHRNVMTNLEILDRRYAIPGETTMVSWLPQFHDMGLVFGLLWAIYGRRHCYLMSPMDFLKRPLRWLEAISTYGAAYTAAPNFAYDLCVRKGSDRERKNLDLSTWQVAFNGAEPVRWDSIERFSTCYGEHGFRKEAFVPCYGMAEAVLFVSGVHRSATPTPLNANMEALKSGQFLPPSDGNQSGTTLTPCGTGGTETEVRIVDPHARRTCRPGDVGEIWVRGATVALGYWQQSALTEETFHAHVTDSGEGPFLRTGDLGFLHDGALVVCGRIKDVVIIRGTNVYPQDLELTVESSHSLLRIGCCAVFGVVYEGEEQLVVVQEIEKGVADEALPGDELFRAIRGAVAKDHDLAIHAIVLIRPGAIRKTSSGKIQRQANKQAFLSNTLDVVASDTVADRGRASIELSLFFFASDAHEEDEDKYALYLDSARLADQRGFKAIWTPERHFHAFGGLYPSPAVLSAAIARETQHLRIRAGSVVLPMHHPIRVAEDWAVVDNLSGGRVDLAFAQGWNANDFVLAPDAYKEKTKILFESADTVARLWRGESIVFPNGADVPFNVSIFPLPKQKELTIWITCSGSRERFEQAGTSGHHIITALLFQTVTELEEKLKAYREARAAHGFDPDGGHVTLMLHTYVGETIDHVRDLVRKPFIRYLESSVDLWRNESESLEDLAPAQRAEMLEVAFERYYQSTSLFGTVETCRDKLALLQGAGVDEVACLIDFGLSRQEVLAGVERLGALNLNGTLRAAPLSPAPAPELEDSEDVLLLEDYLQARVAEVLAVPPHEVPLETDIMDLGMASIALAELIGVIERDQEIRLHPREFFEYGTIKALAAHLSNQSSDHPAKPAPELPSGSLSTGGNFTLSLTRSRPTPISNGATRNPPITFLLSAPRSGSTLLRVMLEGNPKLFAPPELHLLPFERMAERQHALSDSYLGEGLERTYMALLGLSGEESRDHIRSMVTENRTTQAVYADLQKLSGNRQLVDKSPSYGASFNTLQRAELQFDQPKYIHLVRHPYAVVESIVRNRFHAMLGAQAQDPHDFGAQVWSVTNANIADFLETIAGHRHHVVFYEDLVANPRPVLEGICRFLEIPFDEGMLSLDRGNRMTDGVQEGAIPVGDPSFSTHSEIDRHLGNAWKGITLDRPLDGFARRVAREFGYLLPREHPEGAANLIPIQTKGSRPPFFCVHSLSGTALCYVALSRHMGKDQPFYGFQAQGLFDTEPPHETVRAMAASYIQSMQLIQPSGPYYIGGHSSGGAVAFEMAQQLRARGEDVGFVAMLDAAPPPLAPVAARMIVDLLEHAPPALWLCVIACLVDELTGHEEPPLSYHDLAELAREEQFRLVQRRISRSEDAVKELVGASLEAYVNVFLNTLKIALSYRPEPSTAKVLVFRCSKNATAPPEKKAHTRPSLSAPIWVPGLIGALFRTVAATAWRNWYRLPIALPQLLISGLRTGLRVRDPYRGWKPFVKKGHLNYVEVPGNHLDVLVTPNVNVLGELIRSAIDETETKQ